jgi:hypothetical protein
MVAFEKGPVGLIASDLVNEIPRVLKVFMDGKLPPSLNSKDHYSMNWIL